MVLLALLAVLAACGEGSDRTVSGVGTSGAPNPTAATSTTSTTSTTTTTSPSTSTSTTTTTTSTTTSTTSTTSTTTTTTTTVPPAATPDPTGGGDRLVLERGQAGAAVRELQHKLRELRYWVPADGDFGRLTEQAVYAFQKANRISVDGRVGPQTRAALANPTAPTPRSTSGRVVEIDKSRQLLYTVVDGELEWVFHTSTGTEKPYRHPSGRTAMADTPPGTHTVFWQVDGWDDGVLGPLYRPRYFHRDGIAVHGYDAVPPYPASHGCVRVTLAAMDYIWANDLMPMGSTVLVYGQTPPV
ncbi:MAG TPA: L,D-transpeptidase family protein [Acidimicrobiales bacterium]|nr:L,D-transpeptidase family protein [Acidimicrobiales bacterium]